MAKPLPASLSQKIAQSQLGSGSSLVPQAPVKDEPPEAIPTVEELIGDQEDLATLNSLVSSVLVPKAEVKRLKKVIDAIVPRIKAIVSQYGFSKAVCAGATLNYFPTSRKSINATKLLAAGVTQEIITACTDVTPSYTLKIGDDE
jgi:hypothetical protein